MGFSLTQLTCDLHHFTQFTSRMSPMPAWPLVVGEEGQEKELRSGNFHVLRRAEELDIDECYDVYTQLPIRDEQISVPVRKLYFPSCFLSCSDSALRSGEKIPLSPFYQWGSMPRRLSDICNTTESPNTWDGTRFWVSLLLADFKNIRLYIQDQHWNPDRSLNWPATSLNLKFHTYFNSIKDLAQSFLRIIKYDYQRESTYHRVKQILGKQYILSI